MSSILECRGLDAGYAGKAVVRGLDMAVEPGEIVSLLGPNGAGKTTVLLTLAGLVPKIGGEITVGGEPCGSGAKATRQGVVLVPDDRSLFTTLTVRENLSLACRKGGGSMGDVLGYFPQLNDRMDVLAGLLSGGEQQMLAVGRALVQRPRVLLIDELSMGLAPIVVERLLEIVGRIAGDTGTAVVLVEQHVKLVLATSHRAIVLVHGEVALTGPSADLLDDTTALERAYLAG